MAKSYLVQEEDGTSRFTLEEGGGFLLLAEFGIAVVAGGDKPGATVMASGEGGSVGDTVTGGDRPAAEVEPT